MATALIVVRAFGQHRPGDMITDPAEARTLLLGEHAHDVIRVAAPAAAPAAASKGREEA
jgi:hypothetical protein